MDIILERDHLKTVSPKFGPNRPSSVRGNRFLKNCPVGSYVKTVSADGGHLGCKPGSSNVILKRTHLKTISIKFGPNYPNSFIGKDLFSHFSHRVPLK